MLVVNDNFMRPLLSPSLYSLTRYHPLFTSLCYAHFTHLLLPSLHSLTLCYPSLLHSLGVVYATSFPALDAAIEEVSKFFETKTVTGDTVPNVIAALRLRLETATGPLSAAAGRRFPVVRFPVV